MIGEFGPVLRDYRVSQEYVRDFAFTSGDFNPLHIDPIAARRLLFGRQVVHGVASTLEALDAHFEHGGTPPLHLDVVFRRPVFLDDRIQVLRAKPTSDVTSLQVRCNSKVAITLKLRGDLGYAAGRGRSTPIFDAQWPEAPLPQTRSFGDAGPSTGAERVVVDKDRFQEWFPYVHRALGEPTAAAIAGLSRLVGMVIPGEHSIFTRFSVEFTRTEDALPDITWAIERATSPSTPMRIAVSGAGLKGHVEALFRPSPVTQPSMREVQTLGLARQKEPDRVLVVGGSRGLGEVCAKILASIGSDITITFFKGQSDAERVSQEIIEAGGTCSNVQAEVDALPQLVAQAEEFDQVYYFATPPIIGGNASTTNEASEYTRIYVDAFERLVQALGSKSHPTSVFYPSTEFVVQRPAGLEAYADAKSAGEEACRRLEHEFPLLRIVCSRIPPVKTDQTNSLLASGSVAALPIASEVVQSMLEEQS